MILRLRQSIKCSARQKAPAVKPIFPRRIKHTPNLFWRLRPIASHLLPNSFALPKKDFPPMTLQDYRINAEHYIFLTGNGAMPKRHSDRRSIKLPMLRFREKHSSDWARHYEGKRNLPKLNRCFRACWKNPAMEIRIRRHIMNMPIPSISKQERRSGMILNLQIIRRITIRV